MKLAPIVAEIRRHCPSFEGRVYGSVEFADIESLTNLPMPCSFVLPLGESTSEPIFSTDYMQDVEQSFGVVVFVKNSRDRTGMDAYDSLEEIKAEIHRVLTGWVPNEDSDPVVYDGSSVLDVNRERLAVQFEFTLPYAIRDEDTRHGVDISTLPDLELVDVKVDQMVPDGSVEAEALLKLGG